MIVLSAVSIRNAGPLKVLKSAILDLSLKYDNLYVIVGDDTILSDFNNISKVIVKWPRKSWIHRLFFEYVWLYFWSRKYDIDCWISYHDITPLVKAKKQIVYCHNPMPFFNFKLKNLINDYKQFLFSYLYIFVYRFFINRNNIVVVQQQWLKMKFKNFFKNTIVVMPAEKIKRTKRINKKIKLIYPSYPRATKNHVYLIEFYKKIKDYCELDILFTFSEDENKISKKLKNKSKNLDGIKFIGWLNNIQLRAKVEECDAIVFPSLAETWGLPMVEFADLNILTFVSDRDFAAETCSGVNNIIYFNPDDVNSLTRIFMSKFNIYENEESRFNNLSEVVKEII